MKTIKLYRRWEIIAFTCGGVVVGAALWALFIYAATEGWI